MAVKMALPTELVEHIVKNVRFPKPATQFQDCSEFDKQRFYQKYPKYSGVNFDEAYYTTHRNNTNWLQLRFDILGGGGSYVWHDFACPFCLHLPVTTSDAGATPFWFYCDLCDMKVVPDISGSRLKATTLEPTDASITFDLRTGEYSNVQGVERFSNTALSSMKMVQTIMM